MAGWHEDFDNAPSVEELNPDLTDDELLEFQQSFDDYDRQVRLAEIEALQELAELWIMIGGEG